MVWWSIFFCLKGKYPKIIKNPVVSVIDRVTGRLTFKCTVESKEKHERVRHEITWFQGPPGKQFKIDIIGGSSTEAYMQNSNSLKSHPLFPLGQEVSTKPTNRSFKNIYFSESKCNILKKENSIMNVVSKLFWVSCSLLQLFQKLFLKHKMF